MNSNIHAFTKKVIKFYLVGWLSLFGNWAITYIVSDYFHKPLVWSLLLIFIFNMTAVFYLQKNFTFQNKQRWYLNSQTFWFTVILLFIMLTNYVGVPYIKAIIWSNSTSLLVISLVISVLNYIVQYLLFNSRRYDKQVY